MKRILGLGGMGLVLILFLTFGAVVWSEEKASADKASEKEALEKKIAGLISDLGADEAEVRESATEELKKIGKPAVPALKEATKSDDPEAAWRARVILRAIERTEEPKPKEDTEKIWPKVQNFSNKFRIIIQGDQPYQSFSLSRDPSGKITVVIKKKTKEGEEKTETYSADSTEEFIEKYPEIAKQYNINKSEKEEIPEIKPEEIWQEFDELFSKRFEEIRKSMKEMEERMKRMLEGQDIDELLPSDISPKRMPKEKPTEIVEKGELGMVAETIEPELIEHLKLESKDGILIKEVKKDSLAEKIGFKQWDIVLEVDEQPVKTIWEFRRLMKEALAKDEVTVNIIRKGERQMLKYKK